MCQGNARWPGVEAALLGALVLGAFPAFAGAPKPETELRATFAEAYRTTEPAGRLNAVALLKGAKEPVTQQMLYTVLRVEKDVNVRLLAFESLCGYEDPEGKIAHLATEVFKQEKIRDTRKKMARAMAGLRYRYEPLGALCHFLTTLRYPLLPDSDDRRNRNQTQSGGGSSSSGSGAFGGSGGFSRKLALETRKYFEELLQIFNGMAGQHFAAKYETPVEVRKWWKEQGAVFLRKDLERRQAYRLQEQKKQEQQKRNAIKKGKP